MRAMADLEKWSGLTAELEEQEAVAKRQRRLEGERLREADRRRALLLAERDGDDEQLAALEREVALEKKAAEFRQMGMDEGEARVWAAEELALEDEVKARRELKSAQEALDKRQSSWLRDGLANVGGGGVSMRLYESQGLKVAQSTERYTREVAQGVQELITEVKQKSFAGFTTLQ